ncbi:aldo/keto reductase [Paenibacillus sp. WQ 127069]|uniref:Aldo/keto reductase n=1 Tax=Paenibacillus baimaensis TaxID=2982185 RepID=A0ABT2UAP2_9BACL|nr:aldo/keto reductase [Paenibacillus sp. WQ 127069]MCU6790977.1 aldo/keto reductase [Paenibacillus sp. WQ 127069]
MQTSVFARSGETISRLGFGGMGLNGIFGQQDDAAMIRSIVYALENGVNFIDTARVYGRSEELIGKALKEWNGERPFIATKAAASAPPHSLPGAGFHFPLDVQSTYPPGSIRTSVEQSLQAMDIETLDLLQLHVYWPQWDGVDYWMEELLRLKEEGKVRYLGVSLPDHRHDHAISLVRAGVIDSVQTIVNIFDSVALDCLVPICQENKVAVIARVILDEGGLTGFLKEDTVIPDSDYRYNYFDCQPRSVYLDKVDRLRQYVPQYASSLTELAIKFVLKDPGVTVAISSMQVLEYAAENIAACDKEALPDELFELIKIRERWIRHFYHARRHL